MNDENKELYFFDFDKLFENYADKYYNEHEAEYSSPEDFAKRDLDNVYHTWRRRRKPRSAEFRRPNFLTEFRPKSL